MNIHENIRPYIRFETRTEEDRSASIEAGKKVYKDVDWVIVVAAGSRDEHENYAVQWLSNISNRANVGQYDISWVEHFKKMYSIFKEGKELPEDGTSLKMCSTLFTPSEIKNCINANIRTLEQLANASEEAISRLPMAGRSLKLRAQESLKIGDGANSAMKIEAITLENDELKRKINELTDIVNDLRNKVQNSTNQFSSAQDEEPSDNDVVMPRRGRPPKQI